MDTSPFSSLASVFGGALSQNPSDLTQQYNTPLQPDEEASFQEWAKANGRQNDVKDYDLRGAWKSNAQQAQNGHLPDTYKKPNHPTFSDESQYHNAHTQAGGRWVEENGKWAFHASPLNVQNLGADRLKRYFQEREPDALLRLPQP